MFNEFTIVLNVSTNCVVYRSSADGQAATAGTSAAQQDLNTAGDSTQSGDDTKPKGVDKQEAESGGKPPLRDDKPLPHDHDNHQSMQQLKQQQQGQSHHQEQNHNQQQQGHNQQQQQDHRQQQEQSGGHLRSSQQGNVNPQHSKSKPAESPQPGDDKIRPGHSQEGASNEKKDHAHVVTDDGGPSDSKTDEDAHRNWLKKEADGSGGGGGGGVAAAANDGATDAHRNWLKKEESSPTWAQEGEGDERKGKQTAGKLSGVSCFEFSLWNFFFN